jgi:hypothetical protein
MYDVYVISLNEVNINNIPLIINSSHTDKVLELNKKENLNGYYLYSVSTNLLPGDTIHINASNNSTEPVNINNDEITLDKNIVGLFAIRQSSTNIDFYTSIVNSEEGKIIISNADSDYVIVDQYMNTPLRYIETKVDNQPILVNLFFNGWVLKPKNASTENITVNIGIQNYSTTKLLTYFSILFTYTILMILIYPKLTKFKSTYVNLFIQN